MNNETKKEITLDDLALMVGKGFNDVNEKMDKQFKEVKSDIQRLDTEIKKVKSDTEEIKADLNKKVDKFTHNGLEYRVEKLEKKFA